MKLLVKESFGACLNFIYGLFFGLVLFFYGRSEWVTGDFLSTSALFVSYVLFNALVMSVIAGAIVSLLIFPLQYFIIKQSNRITSVSFFVAGFAMGSIFLKAAIIKFG